MISRTRVLGLTLVAVLLISATVASVASATPLFTAAAYPTKIDATGEEAIGAESEYFESVGRKLECEKVHYSGTLSEKSNTMTVTPDVTDHTQGGNCRAGGSLVVTVTENGCQYLLHVAEKSSGDYKLRTDVVCPEGKTIVTHIRNLLNNADACTITIGPQITTGTMTTTNSSGHVNVSGSIGIKQTLHSSNTALCGQESGTSKEVTTNYVINKALTVTGNGTEISISGE
jgi:hypothetical protein